MQAPFVSLRIQRRQNKLIDCSGVAARSPNCGLVLKLVSTLGSVGSSGISVAVGYRKIVKLEMWANAQRDGRPAEYRWRPLFNAAKFG